jgi:hypothetical protein
MDYPWEAFMKKHNSRSVNTAPQERVPTKAGRPYAADTISGKPTETTSDCLTPAMRDAMDGIWRQALVRSSKIDYPVAIFNSLKALDALYGAFMRQGDLDRAFNVLREKNKLLSLERHVQPRTESDSWDERRDPYFHAIRELDPVDLHEAGQRRAKLDDELRALAYAKTGRHPDGAKKQPSTASNGAAGIALDRQTQSDA